MKAYSMRCSMKRKHSFEQFFGLTHITWKLHTIPGFYFQSYHHVNTILSVSVGIYYTSLHLKIVILYHKLIIFNLEVER